MTDQLAKTLIDCLEQIVVLLHAHNERMYAIQHETRVQTDHLSAISDSLGRIADPD